MISHVGRDHVLVYCDRFALNPQALSDRVWCTLVCCLFPHGRVCADRIQLSHERDVKEGGKRCEGRGKERVKEEEEDGAGRRMRSEGCVHE